MAEGDQKIKILEEETKVLKGEIRRILVDLRALIMREDSPLNDRPFRRRAALADLAPGDETGLSRSIIPCFRGVIPQICSPANLIGVVINGPVRRKVCHEDNIADISRDRHGFHVRQVIRMNRKRWSLDVSPEMSKDTTSMGPRQDLHTAGLDGRIHQWNPAGRH